MSPEPWKVCTVTQVEEIKILKRMLPIIASTIITITCMAQLQTFSVHQDYFINPYILAQQVPYSINISNTNSFRVHPHTHLSVHRGPFCLKDYWPHIRNYSTPTCWNWTHSFFYFYGYSIKEEKKPG